MRLATEKFVPKFYEKIAEGGRGRRSWDEIFCDHRVKPIGSTDGDQSEANAMTVPHRTENVSFSPIKVLISVVNDRMVRKHRLVGFSNVFGDFLTDTYLRWAERQRQIYSIVSEHWKVIETCGILTEWLVSLGETPWRIRTGGKRLSLEEPNAGREG